VTFVYVSRENKFGVFHSHTKVIPPGGQACDAVTVGLLSDKINGNVAGKIEVPMASNPFNRFFVSIAPIDRIKSSGFDVIEAVTPDVIHKPDGTSTNTNAELGFPGAMDEGLPAFVTLPVLFPVPPPRKGTPNLQEHRRRHSPPSRGQKLVAATPLLDGMHPLPF
jgi:hypothetical protein